MAVLPAAPRLQWPGGRRRRGARARLPALAGRVAPETTPWPARACRWEPVVPPEIGRRASTAGTTSPGGASPRNRRVTCHCARVVHLRPGRSGRGRAATRSATASGRAIATNRRTPVFSRHPVPAPRERRVRTFGCGRSTTEIVQTLATIQGRLGDAPGPRRHLPPVAARNRAGPAGCRRLRLASRPIVTKQASTGLNMVFKCSSCSARSMAVCPQVLGADNRHGYELTASRRTMSFHKTTVVGLLHTRKRGHDVCQASSTSE